MQIKITGSLDIDIDTVLKNHGLEPNGRVQKFIDSEVIRLMDDYTPDRNGILKASIRLNSVIGSGLLTQATPYARYQYYGKLYVDPVYLKGSFYSDDYGFWSRPGVKKIPDPSGRELNYSTAKSRLAGKMWFERMKADKKDQLLKGAVLIAGGKI